VVIEKDGQRDPAPRWPLPRHKRHERALVTYLTEPELDALIDAPDRSTWTGRRDHTIIVLLAQTGLRASELTGLTCGDINLGTGAHVTTIGKGPQTADHPADERDRRGPARVAGRTR
jgi:integrase